MVPACTIPCVLMYGTCYGMPTLGYCWYRSCCVYEVYRGPGRVAMPEKSSIATNTTYMCLMVEPRRSQTYYTDNQVERLGARQSDIVLRVVICCTLLTSNIDIFFYAFCSTWLFPAINSLKMGYSIISYCCSYSA